MYIPNDNKSTTCPYFKQRRLWLLCQFVENALCCTVYGIRRITEVTSTISSQMEMKVSDEKFLATVLHESRHSYNGHNPYKDPPLDLLLSTFKTTARHFGIDSQMENRCFQALLLFTADTSLAWKHKIDVISRYFVHTAPRSTKGGSKTETTQKVQQSISHSPDITSFRPPQPHIINSGYPLSAVSTNDMAEGHFLTALLNSTDFDASHTNRPAPSKLTSTYELHFNVPPANPARLETPQKADRKDTSPSPFGRSKSLSPVHLSSPVELTSFRTTDSIDRFRSTGSGANMSRYTATPCGDIGGTHEHMQIGGGMATTGTTGSSPTEKPSKSILAAQQHWAQRRMHYAICRFLWNRYRRRGKAVGQRLSGDVLVPGLTARAQIRRLRKLSSLRGGANLSSGRLSSSGQQMVAISSNSPHDLDATNQGVVSADPAGHLEVLDPIPLPSTIRLLALLQRFLASKPLGSFAHGAYRHPAPGLMLHLSKLSVKFKVEDGQEVWLRARAYQFLKMETMDLCFRLWTAEIYFINQAKAFFISKSLRRGFESLQDFALAREGPRRGVYGHRGDVHFCRRAAGWAMGRLKETKSRNVTNRNRTIIADGHLGDRLSIKYFYKWRNESVMRYRLERKERRSCKNRQAMRRSLLRILFRRFRDRAILFPAAHRVALQRFNACRRQALWGWMSVFISSNWGKRRLAVPSGTDAAPQVISPLPTPLVTAKTYFAKWKLIMWRAAARNKENCRLGTLHYHRRWKSTAVRRWIRYKQVEMRYRSESRRRGVMTVPDPINTNILAYFYRWRRSIIRIRRSMEYILRRPKRVRMLHGYPVNNGHMVAGSHGPNGHISLSASSFKKLWQLSIGIGPSPSSSGEIQVCVISGMRRFQRRVQHFAKQRQVDRHGYLVGLGKMFKNWRHTTHYSALRRTIMHRRCRKLMMHWRAAKVVSAMTRRLLYRSFCFMRKYTALRDPLQRSYIRIMLPPVAKAFYQIKSYAHHCKNASATIATRRQHWSTKFTLHWWKTLSCAIRTHKRVTQRIALCNYFKKRQNYRKLEKMCALRRQFGRMRGLVQRQLLSSKLGLSHFKIRSCYEVLRNMQEWVSVNRSTAVMHNRAASLYKVLAGRRAMTILKRYISMMAMTRHNAMYARLFMSLWKLTVKLNARFKQHRLLFIAGRYHATQIKRDSLKRWVRGMKHSQKLRYGNKVARKYYKHRKQSFALVLLQSMAQGSGDNHKTH